MAIKAIYCHGDLGKFAMLIERILAMENKSKYCHGNKS